MRLRDRPRHYRCCPFQQKLWEVTCAVPETRRCPHPPHRRHPGQRGLMACQPFPRQRTWLQRASRQLQGREGGKENAQYLSMCTAHGVCNEVWCRPFPTNLRSPIHHCLIPAQRHAQCNNVTLGTTVLHTAFSCGEQVPDEAIPHYRVARMQHSQSR